MTPRPSKGMMRLTSYQRGFTFGEVYYNANPTLDTQKLLTVAVGLRVPNGYDSEQYRLGFTQCYDEMRVSHSKNVNQLTTHAISDEDEKIYRQESEENIMANSTSTTDNKKDKTSANLRELAKQRAEQNKQESDAERQAYVNHCMFSGRLGKDVELSYTQTGKGILKSSLAVYMGGKGDEKITMWLELVLWEQSEDTDKYKNNNELVERFLAMEKGEEVVAEGRLGKRSWEGKDYYSLTLENIT